MGAVMQLTAVTPARGGAACGSYNPGVSGGTGRYDVAVSDGADDGVWELRVGRRGRDWTLTLTGPERTWSADGADLFEALRDLRRQLGPLNVRIGCNGARRDAWASGMQRDMGEGRVVYLLVAGQAGRPVQVDTLGPARIHDVGTVAEQDAYHAQWLATRSRL
jgi:hypothetical protein